METKANGINLSKYASSVKRKGLVTCILMAQIGLNVIFKRPLFTTNFNIDVIFFMLTVIE